MFSFGGGDSKPEDYEQPQNTLQEIDANEKARLITSIDNNKYVRRSGGWNFRRDLGPKEYLMRLTTLAIIFCIAFMSKPGTPRGREDKDWLIEFALVMSIWYTAVHSLAYVPGMVFCGFEELTASLWGGVSHAYNNWRDYQYAAFIIVFIVVMYPFGLFAYLMYDGFNPYSELTAHELKPEGGMSARICYVFRIVLHFYMCCTTIYLVLMALVAYCIRVRQAYPGENTWLARKISFWPYGSLFFEEGEYFDCAICLQGIWKGQIVVRLNCEQNDRHVYHADCLRD